MSAPTRNVALPRPTALEWLYLAIGLTLVVRYRWLMDDSFVYFRYVDNLLFMKLGLVYNAGEFVEGFSSPLHCLLLIALRVLGLSWPAIVTGVGCAAFMGFWALLVTLNRELSPRDSVILNLPLAYLVTNYGLDSFFTSGLETPLAHLMAPTLALYLLRPQSRWLAALLALAPLARPELALAVGLAALFVWWRFREFPWSLLVASMVASGGWLVFRIHYYADLLPNTFYLKDGVHFEQGWRYLLDTAGTYHVAGFAAVVVGVALFVRQRAKQSGTAESRSHASERIAMLVIAGVIAAYVARVGGSHVHYWYLAFPFSLAVCASAGILEAAMCGRDVGRRRVLAPVTMLGVSLGVFFMVPPQLSVHPFFGGGGHEPVDFIDDAAWHRRHASLQPELFSARMNPEMLRGAGRQVAARGYARILAGTWCRRQYVGIRDRWVHGFGLTDAVLARTEAGWLKPGHKTPLIPLSKDIVRIERDAAIVGPGLYRRAVEAGRAPAWVVANLASIEVIERKIYNHHDFRENLELAFRFPPRIVIPGAPTEPPPVGVIDSEG
ncbi:MAG: hypothetical protein JRG80_04375 [Deltaproteobacteria bacterium]|nr:hypothetical protein [Deltaproteobacteria bacterium]